MPIVPDGASSRPYQCPWIPLRALRWVTQPARYLT